MVYMPHSCLLLASCKPLSIVAQIRRTVTLACHKSSQDHVTIPLRHRVRRSKPACCSTTSIHVVLDMADTSEHSGSATVRGEFTIRLSSVARGMRLSSGLTSSTPSLSLCSAAQSSRCEIFCTRSWYTVGWDPRVITPWHNPDTSIHALSSMLTAHTLLIGS